MKARSLYIGAGESGHHAASPRGTRNPLPTVVPFWDYLIGFQIGTSKRNYLGAYV